MCFRKCSLSFLYFVRQKCSVASPLCESMQLPIQVERQQRIEVSSGYVVCAHTVLKVVYFA